MTHQPPLFSGGDIEAKIGKTGCASFYEKVETCMGSSERDWRKCQTELMEFRKCMQSSPGEIIVKDVK